MELEASLPCSQEHAKSKLLYNSLQDANFTTWRSYSPHPYTHTHTHTSNIHWHFS